MKPLVLLTSALLSTSVLADSLTFSVHDFAPYVTVTNTKASGPFVELVNTVCQRQGLSCQVDYYPNRRAKTVLETGEVNGNFPLGWNAKRDEWLHWTPPLMAVEYGFFINSGSGFQPSKIEDMAGKTVGVFGPSNTATSLDKINQQLKDKGLTPIKVAMIANSTGQNMQKLAANRIDAVFLNRSVGQSQITGLNIEGVQYAFTTKRLRYYAGFAKQHNDKALVDKFNAGVTAMDESGELATLVKKYGLEPIDKSLNIK